MNEGAPTDSCNAEAITLTLPPGVLAAWQATGPGWQERMTRKLSDVPGIKRADLEEFVGRLVARFAPDRVILFGSLAEGTAGADSDADLLVVMPFAGRAFEMAMEIHRVCKPDFPMDLILRRPEEVEVRYRQGDPFIRAALDRGEVLHG